MKISIADYGGEGVSYLPCNDNSEGPGCSSLLNKIGIGFVYLLRKLFL